MNVIRWEEPPVHGNTGRSRSRPSKYQAIADELRANPGQWAIVLEDLPTGSAGAMVHRIKAGKGLWAPGGFEARCVGRTGGMARVYARYVGEER